MNTTTLVLGAGGFIGHHLVKRLKHDGCHVVGVDVKHPEFEASTADRFIIQDLRSFPEFLALVKEGFDEIYQLAADMGGAGYIFSGQNDAEVMTNSGSININLCQALQQTGLKPKVFFSSSACIYPEHNQLDPNQPDCRESTAYPAAPDSEYGWEKLFSERLYLSLQRNFDVPVRIARFHNIFGPLGTYDGGREKAPAALCRKIAQAQNHSAIEIWGDGKQTRSFLYIEECIEGILRLMESEFSGPVNLGSEQMITINQLAEMIIAISGKQLSLAHVDGPLGVRGRSSNNTLIREKLGWAPKERLEEGLRETYGWIARRV